MTLKKEYKGFTLIELMVVMAIIAVLSTLIIGAIQLARKTATETTHRSNGKTVQTALEGSYANYRKYCGAAGQVACGTYSFAKIAGDTGQNVTNLVGNLKAKLGTAATTCNGASDGNYNGGGTITISADTYTITPYDSTCANAMTPDVLTN